MIAFRRAVVAFLAALLLSGPVAATAPPAASQRVAVYTYDAPVYDQPIGCTASERGPPTCSVTSVVPAGHDAFDSTAPGALARPEASAIAATYDYDGNPQFVQAANNGSTGAETVAATSTGLSTLSPAGVAAKGVDIGGAKFAQKSFSETFSKGGAFSGRTIDDVAGDLRSGALTSKDVPIDVIVRDGNSLILNTRSSQALIRAGVPRSSWNVIDRTGQSAFEARLSGQLGRNGLTSSGIDF